MSTILVIDDNESVCRMLKSLLEKNGFEVQVAFNGEEGIQYINILKFDLVITDIFMPYKDGLETIQEIKKQNQDAKIIAISGGGNFESPTSYLDMAAKLGADFTMNKPLNDKRLLIIINLLLTGNNIGEN